MSEDEEWELRLALAKGILGPEEVPSFREQLRRLGCRPLDLLATLGRLDPSTLDSLRRQSRTGDPRGPADPVVLNIPPARSPELSGEVLDAPTVGSDATVFDPRVPASGQEGPADFPVRDWDRYRPIRLLGQGGMGKVFLALDVRLNRQVALKFVRGDNPRHTAMLLLEARAQARVSHDRVCKVFDVGEVQGQVYISMQYIEGQPLSRAAGSLSFEQKAMAIRDAAEGVHEAHREGIIHRDLKPGNIMIERSELGQIRTYVMDFGLARDRMEGDAETGRVMGTPHYMSPEQARGEVARLDRRADVYSLGAAFYEILAGRPPIPGANELAVLTNIATVEPSPLRGVDQDVPADLEAVVLKCLEKERSARYDSARALAEDIDRFLNGEPVWASRAGAWYRVQKRIRKHRRLLLAGTTAAALLMGSLGWGLWTRGQAAERERLARRFTTRVEQVEAMARYSALSRLHDTRRDQEQIRERMRDIEAEIGAAGPLAKGAGAYALGRGYLALGDDARARSSLEQAWSLGFQEPRVAYVLAVVLGHLYQKELVEVERLRNDTVRARRKQEIETRYRTPAISFLRLSGGADVASKDYLAALTAYYEGRFEEALTSLDQIGTELPWFYEAPELRGDVLFAMAVVSLRAGDREAAGTRLEAARSAYARAGEIAESNPRVWRAAGALEYQTMLMELYGKGEVKTPFERGTSAVGRALLAQPGDPDALVLSAQLNRGMAEVIGQHGGNAEEFLAKAVAAATAALATPSPPLSARLELARNYSQWGQYLQEQNRDPRDPLGKAEEIIDGLRPEEQDYDTHLMSGLVAQTWAEYEDETGVSSAAQRTRAIAAYRAAATHDQLRPGAWINLATCHLALASQPGAADTENHLQEARKALDASRALDPGHFVSYFHGGKVFVRTAERARIKGADARPHLEAGLKLYREGIAVNPTNPHLHNGAGDVLLRLATEAWDHGEDPEPALDAARKAFDQASVVAPDQGFAYHNLCEAWSQSALYRRAQGVDPRPQVEQALKAEEKALLSLRENPNVWANLASAHLILAEFGVDQNQDPTPAANLAFSAATNGLARNPRFYAAQYALGRVHAVRARWLARGQGAAAAQFELAAVEMQKAIDLAPEAHDQQVALGHLCRDWARALKSEDRDPDPTLQRGFAVADGLVRIRPDWPEARLVRGSLFLTRAELSQRPAEQEEDAQKALVDLTKAFTGNRHLETAWAGQLSAARRLAGNRSN